MTPRAPAAALTDRELRLYTVLAKHVIRTDAFDGLAWCSECGRYDKTRAAVRHAPWCVFFGLDADTLAAISADWTP